jgi:hypothetical protein
VEPDACTFMQWHVLELRRRARGVRGLGKKANLSGLNQEEKTMLR